MPVWVGSLLRSRYFFLFVPLAFREGVVTQMPVQEPGRQSFGLLFPADLTTTQVAQWVRALGGILTSGPRRLFSVPTVVCELWATDRGIRFRLTVPPGHADYLVAQLRVHLPGIRVTPTTSATRPQWTRAVELGLSRSERTLQIPDPVSTAASLLASLQGLRRGECCLIQWVISPAVHERPPPAQRMQRPFRLGGGLSIPMPVPQKDAVLDQRSKLSEPNVLGVLRVAVRAESGSRATELLSRVRSILGSVRTADNGFRRRLVRQGRLKRSINEGRAPLLFPIQLSVSELVALLGWPAGSPNIAGLPQARTRHLPATEAIPRRGRVLAISNFPGAERPLALSVKDSCTHLHIVGPTGTGKTALMSNLVVQDMGSGAAVVVIESKSDLFLTVLERVPRKRLQDVIVLDVTDAAFPVGFNVLGHSESRATVEKLCALFERLYHDTRGVWTREVLYHGLATLTSQPGYTFVDLAPLLVPMTSEEEAWRDELIRSLADRELRNFWQRFLNQPRAAQDRISQPVMDRIWQLNARPEIRNIIGQSKSSFSMSEVVEQGKILLVNLSGVGSQTASLTGTLLMDALWAAVQSSSRKRPVFLHLDEFQDFLQLPIDPADMFAKARSYRLSITAAHQHLGQLPVDLRQAILANARSKVVFQTTADDARTFAREFGRQVSETDFMNLGQYEVLCRLAAGEGVSQPVTGLTRPPARRTGLARQVRAYSRQRYGRPAAEVEAEITGRRTPTEAVATERPKLGGQRWN